MILRLSALVPALLLAGLAAAQEYHAPRAVALRIAAEVAADRANLSGTGIPTDPDLKHAVVLRDGDRGVLVLPETRLTATALETAGTAPVAQLWLRGLDLVRDGLPLPVGSCRTVTLAVNGKPVELHRCALGVRQRGDGGRELAVYGDAAEPLLVAPLTVQRADQAQPILISAEDAGGGGGVLRLRLAGAYEAELAFILAVREPAAAPAAATAKPAGAPAF
jgi:hypothetical protein